MTAVGADLPLNSLIIAPSNVRTHSDALLGSTRIDQGVGDTSDLDHNDVCFRQLRT